MGIKTTLLMVMACVVLTAGKAFAQYEVGQKPPELRISKVVAGPQLNTQGKYLLIDFWATWCHPCIESLPKLDAFAGTFGDRLVCLCISGEKEERVSEFLTKRSYPNLTFALDGMSMHTAFNVKTVPQYYLISPGGVIVSAGVSGDLTETKLRSLLDAQTPAAVQDKVTVGYGAPDELLQLEIKRAPGKGQDFFKGPHNIAVTAPLNILLAHFDRVPLSLTRFDGVPGEMVEVSVKSYACDADSLYPVVSDLLKKQFQVKSRKEKAMCDVVVLHMKDTSRLIKAGTHASPGVASMMHFDEEQMRFTIVNYSVAQFMEVLEQICPAQIFTTDSSDLQAKYDWVFPVQVNADSGGIDVKSLLESFKSQMGIGSETIKRKEDLTIYSC